MTDVSLEQRGIQQVEKIRQELREYDLSRSQCPVERRRFEKERDEQAQKAQTAQEQKNAANWMAAVDQRIMQHLDYYCLHVFEHDDNDEPSVMNAAIGEIFVEEKRARQKEVKALFEEERRSVDAKFAELAKASDDRSAAIDQQIGRARESVLQSASEVLGQERMDRRRGVEQAIEEERRNYEARIAELEERVRTQPARLPIAKT